MGEILPFSRSARGAAAQVVAPLTNFDVFKEAVDDCLEEWQKHAVNNSLSEFVYKTLPEFARLSKRQDYLNDLNIINAVEQKLELPITVISPGSTPENRMGCLVSFRRGDESYYYPPIMPSEAMARAFNLVVYVTFERRMKAAGRD